MLVAIAFGVVLAILGGWSLLDARRSPQRWAPLFSEQRALSWMAWSSICLGAALAGLALAGANGDVLIGVGTLGVVLVGIEFKVWGLARTNRVLDQFFPRR